MTADTATLSSWLLDQIAADERQAREDGANAMVGWQWKPWAREAYEAVQSMTLERSRRVLATCAAHRRIVEEHPGHRVCERCMGDPRERGGFPTARSAPCPTLRALAAIYVDRPGFREEWRL